MITVTTMFSVCRLGQAESQDINAQLSTLRWMLNEMIFI